MGISPRTLFAPSLKFGATVRFGPILLVTSTVVVAALMGIVPSPWVGSYIAGSSGAVPSGHASFSLPSESSFSNGSAARGADPPNPDWVTYLGNVERTSNSTNQSWLTPKTAPNLVLAWKVATVAPIVSSASVADGNAYFGSWNGSEIAVNATTGATVWTRFLGLDKYDSTCPGPLGISSAPTIDGTTLYVGGNNATGGANATWYALNALTGKILWSVPIGNMSKGYYNWASPLIYDGFAYVGIASDCDKPLVQAGLDQINLTTHTVKTFHTTPLYEGAYEIGASIWSSPSVDPNNNTIFVTTGNPPPTTKVPEPYSESIIALNATTLDVESHWQVPSTERVGDGDFGAGATVLAHAGSHGSALVVAGNKNGYEYAWNASNVALGPLWRIDTKTAGQSLLTPASYGGGRIYFSTPSTKLKGVSVLGSVWAVTPATGHVDWNHSLPGKAIGAPLYVNGLLVVPGGNKLEFFNATSGKLLTVKLGVKFSTSLVAAPIIAENRLIEGCENGTEYAFTLPALRASVTGSSSLAYGVRPGHTEATPPTVAYAAVLGIGAAPGGLSRWRTGILPMAPPHR
jgi:outer membrane protein assembly factor BamB